MKALRGLFVPTLPGMPRVAMARFTGDFADGVVPGIGMAEPYDAADGLRMYRRFHHPRPGTVDGFRANAVATDLVRSADPEAGLVFERVLIVGRSRDGTLIDIPYVVVRRARRLWRFRRHPGRIVRAHGVTPYLQSLDPLSRTS